MDKTDKTESKKLGFLIWLFLGGSFLKILIGIYNGLWLYSQNALYQQINPRLRVSSFGVLLGTITTHKHLWDFFVSIFGVVPIVLILIRRRSAHFWAIGWMIALSVKNLIFLIWTYNETTTRNAGMIGEMLIKEQVIGFVFIAIITILWSLYFLRSTIVKAIFGSST